MSVVEAMSGAAQISTITTPKKGGGVRVRGKKTVMVVPVVDVVVTLKENLPDYLDKDMTLDSLIAGVTSTPLRHRQAITMEDTFDLYDRSMLIAVEPASIADFSTDLFGAMPGAIDKAMLFEPVTAQRKPRPEEERLRSDDRQRREVSELGTILEEGRAADATIAVPGVAGQAIPELYQETTNLFPTAHFDETLVALAPETAVPHPQPPPQQVAETTVVAAPQPEHGGLVVRPRRIM